MSPARTLPSGSRPLISSSDFTSPKLGSIHPLPTVPASVSPSQIIRAPSLIAQGLKMTLTLSATSFIQTISTSCWLLPRQIPIVCGAPTAPQLPSWPPQTPHGIEQSPPHWPSLLPPLFPAHSENCKENLLKPSQVPSLCSAPSEDNCLSVKGRTSQMAPKALLSPL